MSQALKDLNNNAVDYSFWRMLCMYQIMRNYFFYMFTLLGGAMSAQKLSPDSVPASVLSAFDKMYKGAQIRSWEKEQFGLYEAEFVHKARRSSATFNANGLLMRTEEEVKRKDIPAAIITHSGKLYPDYKVEECAKITTPDKKLMYEVEIANGKDRKSLIFSENNEYLREEIDEDDDDASGKK